MKFPTMAVIFVMAGTAGADEVRIATRTDDAPNSNQGADGAVSGFDKALADAVCERISYDCSFVALPGGKVFDGLLAGD